MPKGAGMFRRLGAAVKGLFTKTERAKAREHVTTGAPVLTDHKDARRRRNVGVQPKGHRRSANGSSHWYQHEVWPAAGPMGNGVQRQHRARADRPALSPVGEERKKTYAKMAAIHA